MMGKPQINGAITSRRVNRMYRRLHWKQRRREGQEEIHGQLTDGQHDHDEYYDDYWGDLFEEDLFIEAPRRTEQIVVRFDRGSHRPPRIAEDPRD